VNWASLDKLSFGFLLLFLLDSLFEKDPYFDLELFSGDLFIDFLRLCELADAIVANFLTFGDFVSLNLLTQQFE
jgi:hypothetical protein